MHCPVKLAERNVQPKTSVWFNKLMYDLQAKLLLPKCARTECLQTLSGLRQCQQGLCLSWYFFCRKLLALICIYAGLKQRINLVKMRLSQICYSGKDNEIKVVLQVFHLALKVEYFITIPITFQGLKDC